MPTPTEQQKIVHAYYAKIQEVKHLQQQADIFKEEIESYFYNTLSITQEAKRTSSKTLSLIEFTDVCRWGVEFNLGSVSDNILKSSKYKNQRLGEVVEINPITKLPKEDIEISFIPMECISDEYGEVTELREKKVSLSKGYTKFQEGDLIWARITPCMQNGKSAIAKYLKNEFGCGSTEFHVIRNSNEEIDLNYIYHILRLEPVLFNAMSHFTGSAGQQRVPQSFLEDLLIPVPPISVQNEISAKMGKLKASIKDLENRSISIKNQAEIEFEKRIFG